MCGTPYLVRVIWASYASAAPGSASSAASASIETRDPHPAMMVKTELPLGAARGSSRMAQEGTQAVEATREASFLLAVPEKRLLRWIAARLPRWILPDDMTTLGVLAAFGVCAAYQLTNESDAWLWVASGLLVVQWLGDSLDGTLARVRGIERPRYGYYLDHLVDAIATAAIGIGLGLSPYMLLSVGTLIVVAYLVLSINVYLESQAFGRFSIGYGRIGPTEIRIVLIALNTLLVLGAGLDFGVGELDLTVFDVIGLGIAGGMIAMLAGRAARNLRELAKAEPAASRRG